jgi:glycosyltransferase involved in cell wall biosynthesis
VVSSGGRGRAASLRALGDEVVVEQAAPTAPLTVLHLVTRSHRRGAEVVAVELAAALDDLGHHDEVHAIARAADGAVMPGLPPLVSTRRLGLVTYLRSAWRLRRHLRRQPADIVVAHGGWAAIVVAFAAPTSTLTVWQRILGFPMERWGPLRRRGWRIVTRRFDAIVALTKGMEREARDLGFEGPVWLLPNARDPERFAAIDRTAAAAKLRAELGVAADRPLLAFVGHLVPQKKAEDAVEVLAEVRQHGYPAHLVIAGDGPQRRCVEERIRRLGVADAVTLLGHRDDPELIFGGADLALITSRAEGIPGVAIEAQMTGCPVVTYLLGAVEDVVRDGVTGIVVPWAEPLLMADRVAKLLAEPETLRAMGLAAVDPALAFTTSVTASIYAARFTELKAARDAGSVA